MKMWMFARVVRLCRRVEAARTLQEQEEFEDCVDTILEMCPTLTIEECELVFRSIERGKIPLYNRLKIPEIVSALMQYDMDIATPIRETRHRPEYDRDAPRMSKERAPFLSLSESDILALYGTQTPDAQQP